VDVEVEELATMMLRDPNKFEKIIESITDCVVEISTKTPVYALLAGLLNSEDQGLGGRIVDAAYNDFLSALQKGDRHRSRMHLRFFAALVVTNVIPAGSYLSLLSDMVKVAITAASSAGDSRVWQPWADHMVYCVLAALPWAAPELADAAPEAMDALLDVVAEYIAARPSAHTAALMPFYGGARDHSDRCLQSDSGGASFLSCLWLAIQELKDANWALTSVNKLHEACESRLAQSTGHALPSVQLPSAPPCVEPEMDATTAASTVAMLYRPRGGIRLLPDGVDGSGDGCLAVDRFVVEEFILDTLHWFDGDRRETVLRIGNLPVPFKYEAILIETLFSQLLCLPMPPRKPVGYLTIIVDCMKTIEKFSKPLSGCVRELFSRMDVLDPELQTRLAEWLAYHLSCFDFQWPWARWEHVMEKPATDSQRRFCAAVLGRLLRLSYYDRVAQSVPPAFVPLLPPNPVPQPLDKPMVEKRGDPPPGAAGAVEKRSTEMLAMVRSKVPSEGMMDWISEQQLRTELGGMSGLLEMVLRTLLVAGSKSFTHTLIALERYVDVLGQLIDEYGEEGQDIAVKVAAKVWLNSPQRAAIAIDRLMGMRLVQGSTVVSWVFKSAGMKSVDDELEKGLAMEALTNCTNKMIARAGDERADLAAINTALVEARAAAVEAGDAVRAAAAALETADSGADQARMARHATEAEEREAAAKDQVAEIEQALAEKAMAVSTADNLRDTHFMTVYRSFVELLNPQLQADEDSMTDGAAAHAPWVDAALGSLRAFTRFYFVNVAPVASELIDDVLSEGSVHPSLRSAVLSSLQV